MEVFAERKVFHLLTCNTGFPCSECNYKGLYSLNSGRPGRVALTQDFAKANG